MTGVRKRIGERIVRLDEATSTNTLILENEDWLNAHGLVVIAKHQTAGRGRLGRRWASVPGAQLQFSVAVHWRGRAEAIGLIALAAGLSVAEAIGQVAGLDAKLKWPNDVLLDGRKVCGILIESKPGADGQPRLVVGIGINVLGAAEDFPPEVRGLLTTLTQHATEQVNAEALLQAVLERLEANLARLERGEHGAVLDAWRARSDLPGRRVRVTAGAQVREGRALGIDDDGALIVESTDGTRQRHVSGEVAWLDR